MKPDFSGEYTLNRAASALTGGAAGVHSGTLHIQHADPVLRFRARFVADTKTLEYSFELRSDGREVPTGPHEVSSLRWEGEALMATQASRSPEFDLTISWRYELQQGGRRLQTVEHGSDGGLTETNVWAFDRQ